MALAFGVRYAVRSSERKKCILIFLLFIVINDWYLYTRYKLSISLKRLIGIIDLQ